MSQPMFIQVPCAICKQPVVGKFEHGDPEWAVDKFAKMLTHNACYDRMTKRKTAIGSIFRLCEFYHNASDDQRKVIHNKVRATLLKSTRDYAEVIQETYNAPAIVWQEKFADTLMEHPEEAKVKEVLERYRAYVRKSVVKECREEPQELPGAAEVESTPQEANATL